MPQLVWDNLQDRVYETGLDRGVLYLSDGSAVVWNGLTSIIESFDKELSPIYFDGMKINDLVALGDFSATMKAVTYPDEFLEIEGLSGDRCGIFYGDQLPKTFALSYRTRIGNLLEGDEVGYKIHVIYNLTAVPSDKIYATMSTEPNLTEFEWAITAVPEEITGYRPTAHIIIDSRDVDPWLLEDLEDMLYGTDIVNASLPTLQELVTFLNDWYRVKITDNGDGTWTAETLRNGIITVDSSGLFSVEDVNAIYIDNDTFEISDTKEICQVPQLTITDLGNGIWSASTSEDGLIVETVPGEFEIRNATVIWVDADTYQISDTLA